MKYKSLLTHLSLTPVVFLCAMVSASDAQPACRSITNPSPGSVCYTEWQFSSRQRGEGGTKTHEQLVERVEPNYVIVDTEVIVQEKNGITSNPSPNIVSSSGNASIVNETSSSIRELTEVKNSLQAKAAGCVPPVCGQVQNQLDAVNQKISEYSERKRVAIEAGGNEKILFKWTTKVECSRFGICGPGAWMNGKIKVYQRYLGNPSAIRQESLSLVGSSQVIISSPTTRPNPCPGNNITIRPTSRNLEFQRGKEWNPCPNYKFIFQNDGNLVLYGQNRAIWASGTNNKADLFVVQTDGNVVLYGGGRAVWSTNTTRNSGAFLAIQSDGNLVVYDRNQNVLWSSGTRGR